MGAEKQNNELGRRARFLDYDPPQNGCHIELFLSCSGRRAITGRAVMGAEKQNNELGGLTPFTLMSLSRLL